MSRINDNQLPPQQQQQQQWEPPTPSRSRSCDGVLGGNGYNNLGGNGYNNLGGNGYNNRGSNRYNNLGSNGYNNRGSNRFNNLGSNGYNNNLRYNGNGYNNKFGGNGQNNGCNNPGCNGYNNGFIPRPANNYRPNNYRPNNYRPNNYRPNNYRPNNYRQNNYRANNYRPNNYRPNNYRPNNYHSNHRNTYYNSNYRRQQYNRNNYQPRRFYRSNSRYRNRSNIRYRNRSNSRYRNRYNQRQRNGPRPRVLGNFIPQNYENLGTQLANNAMVDDIATINALPQRQQFTATTTTTDNNNNNNNNTQPFTVYNTNDNQNQQNQQYRQNQRNEQTTSTYRRRQRRNQQSNYQDNLISNNRYAALAEDDATDVESNVDNNDNNEILPINTRNNNKKRTQKRNKNVKRTYLNENRIFASYSNNEAVKQILDSSGNQAYIFKSAHFYDELIRADYEKQLWNNYLKLGTIKNYWAKEVVRRTKTRDDVRNTSFVEKKIEQFDSIINKACTEISFLKTNLNNYWTKVRSDKLQQAAAKQAAANKQAAINKQTETIPDNNATTSDTNNSATMVNQKDVENDIKKVENLIANYIKHCIQHVKKMCESRTELAIAQMNEYKAFEEFRLIANPTQFSTHLVMKQKIKTWHIKNKNYATAQKRVEYKLLPKFITNLNFSFKIDESIINSQDAQATYNKMREITNKYQTDAMTLYVETAAQESELIKSDIDRLLENFTNKHFLSQIITINDDDNDNQLGNIQSQSETEAANEAYIKYHELRTTGRTRKQVESRNKLPKPCSIIGHSTIGPNIINQVPQIKLTKEEYYLLNLGPRFIFNDPQTASRRRITELATLQRKIEARFYEKKVKPGRPVQKFINELDILLQNLHNTSTTTTTTTHHHQFNTSNNSSNSSQSQINNRNISNDIFISSQPQINHRSLKKKMNYHRLIKRLKHKFRLTNTIIRKTDKSKVFHLGKLDDYRTKSIEYMNKTNAYQCLGTDDPLPNLIQRTNKYLLDLRLAKWITQKHYEQLCIKQDEVELAHLYYLPKAHKPHTPLRPIIAGLKHPTIKISKFLDDLLRPLFDKMAINTTVICGFELIKKLQLWSIYNMKQETLLCTIDVADLYTMIPQVEGVLSLKRMLDHFNLKQINGLKIEAIIRLARFVMKNNYFKYDGQFYHQIRGGAMGSPLTLTIANCYMYFFEQNIIKQINNSYGLYVRYIDDIFIAINWPNRHLTKQIDRWNEFDMNIKLTANISNQTDFLDVHIENQNGKLFTSVYHKPSYEPYYLPFNSIHPLHMKKNIVFTMMLRALRYCSTLQSYLEERGKLRMALLLNKYPGQFIDQQFNNVLKKFNINEILTINNYDTIRQRVINIPYKEKTPIDYSTKMFIHFTYCSNMRTFPKKFHVLWQKYFGESPINDISPILGTRNVENLQRRLVNTRRL
ncbi:unnamed protein product [Rotaria sp. Silwood2]|nr:unnamed protein product [Rotaria sp. Silwood2]CAF4508024.1 unnamed protein product [Rotaria sp. Silwood2]